MKILIIGSGIIGIMSAYYLSEAGYEVIVLDKENASTTKASGVNGGQLSFSHATPIALELILKSFFFKQSPISTKGAFSIKSIPYIPQIYPFLSNYTQKNYKNLTSELTKIGIESAKLFNEIYDKHDLYHLINNKGILHFFKKRKSFLKAQKHAEFLSQYNLKYKIYNKDNLLQQPYLSNNNLTGGIYYPLDACADTTEFAQHLIHYMKSKHNVLFLYNQEVQDINIQDQKITDITTKENNFKADIFIIAAGAHSSHITKKMGFNIPIYPLKGYSIHLKIPNYLLNSPLIPDIGLTDYDNKIVYSRNHSALKIAGIFEFNKFNTAINQKYIDFLKEAISNDFPQLKELLPQAIIKQGFRPFNPTYLPIIKQLPIKNSFLNTGNGTLGWTQSAYSGKQIFLLIQNFLS